MSVGARPAGHCDKKLLAVSCALLLIFLLAPPSYTEASDLALHGFLQGGYSANAAAENPDGGAFKWAEERLQLRLEASRDPLYLFIKTDVFYDHIDDKGDVQVREGYLDVVSGGWDLRLGRQIITWGLGDLLFINDVFPKDYEAFYAGRHLEYLKKGVDGVKVGLYPSVANFEVVLVPVFEPNTFPRAGRFYSSSDTRGKVPAVTPGNTEAALKAYRNLGGYDMALYYYRGFARTPSMSSGGSLFYPELTVYGASIEGRAMGGILGLEAGYYESRQDRQGDDSFVPNSSTRLLVAYKRQIKKDFHIGLQYYIQYMHAYGKYKQTLAAGAPLLDRAYQLATLRLTRFLMHQSLRLSLFAFYSHSDGDYLLTPEIKYKFTDNIWAAVGANIFGGDSGGSFGRLDDNDNIYLQMRYEF